VNRDFNGQNSDGPLPLVRALPGRFFVHDLKPDCRRQVSLILRRSKIESMFYVGKLGPVYQRMAATVHLHCPDLVLQSTLS